VAGAQGYRSRAEGEHVNNCCGGVFSQGSAPKAGSVPLHHRRGDLRWSITAHFLRGASPGKPGHGLARAWRGRATRQPRTASRHNFLGAAGLGNARRGSGMTPPGSTRQGNHVSPTALLSMQADGRRLAMDWRGESSQGEARNGEAPTRAGGGTACTLSTRRETAALRRNAQRNT
jgi:hypothetical protein